MSGPIESLPVAVIGAGPVGLAAAAHLRRAGLPAIVLEAGEQAGASVRAWGHVRTFTPWRHVIDDAAAELLTRTGWAAPDPGVRPTGGELVEHYLEPLAAALGDDVRTGVAVVAVTREGLDKTRTAGRGDRPLVLRTRRRDGSTEHVRARAVIDASGTWTRPAPLGVDGLPAVGEDRARRDGIVMGPLPDVLGRDRARFAGRRTLVLGMGHSAANTLLSLGALAREVPGTEVVWAIRRESPARLYGAGDADALAARGRLGTDLRDLVTGGTVELVAGFGLREIVVDGAGRADVVGVTAAGERVVRGVHAVVGATGFRPDLAILSEVRLDLDPALEAPRALAPLIDPEVHSCGTVPPHGHLELTQPEPGLYVVGMKSYGRAPTFLITTGNEQVRSVVAAIAGDHEAADDVQLVLPATGVCSTDLGAAPAGGSDAPLLPGTPNSRLLPLAVGACCS